jgi:hypothetical protein
MFIRLIFLISLISSVSFAHEGLSQGYSCSLEDKIPEGDKRYHTFRYALDLMKERGARNLVETGTARFGKCNCAGDGCSTLVFAEWALENGAILYSVDINGDYLITAHAALGPLAESVELVQSDSIEFLKHFNHQIDFLYLDSYDYEIRHPRPSQQHHLNEIVAAYPWLTKDSIVMIDDCDLPRGGKGKLAIRYLLEKGWKMVANGYQVVLVQDN